MFRQTLEDGFGSLYGPDMMLPGDADLALEHMALSSTGYRGDEIAFRLSYSNDGPDAAIGSYISYKFSPLLKNLSGSVPYTVGGETVSTGEATMNILYFFLGNLEPGQTGEVIVTGTLKKTLSGSAISNGAQIQSRLADPNPLNNTKWSNVPISDSFGSFVGR